MSNQPTSDDLLVSTTTEKKINQAKHIYAVAGQFTDATGVLEDLCSAVCDRDISRLERYRTNVLLAHLTKVRCKMCERARPLSQL
jgi:hypothetical protein